MALDFGEHDDVVYAHAPLTNVVCQVMFSPILSIGSQAGVAGFQEAIRSRYPQLISAQRNANVGLGPDSSTVTVGPPIWKFSSEDESWVVSVAIDFVGLETTDYRDIDDFLSRFSWVLEALRRTLKPASSVRIGLRKVNFIEPPILGDVTSLLDRIRPEILGGIAVNTWPAELAGAASQFQFAEDEDTAMIARWGLGTNAKGVVGFILDTDYFTQIPHAVRGDDDFCTLLRHFSDGMTSFFEWVLTRAYKQDLQPISRTTVESPATP